jgi:imidazolonepropionase-like amidohydrolase
MRAAVRWNVKYGADVIKVCATGGVMSLNDDVDSPQLTQEELNALVDQAHRMRRKAAAHAHPAEGAKRAIRAGIDSIEHGSFLDEEGRRSIPSVSPCAARSPWECASRSAPTPVCIRMAARRAATSVDAELFGIAGRLGTLTPGRIADVIAAPGDPVADIRQTEKVFFVMKEGVIYLHKWLPFAGRNVEPRLCATQGVERTRHIEAFLRRCQTLFGSLH